MEPATAVQCAEESEYVRKMLAQELQAAFPGASKWGPSLGEVFDEIYMNSPGKPRFVFVIDEWDYLFRDPDPYTTTENYLNFLDDLLRDGHAYYCALAYLTGILPLKKSGDQCGLRYFCEFTMVESFILTEYFGFTDDEVRALCAKTGADYEELRDWYNGYRFRGGISMYNPLSVIQAITFRRATSFWTKTETYDVLQHYIGLNMEGLHDAVVQLMKGHVVQVRTGSMANNIKEPEDKDEVLTLLVHLGYLSCETRAGKDSLISIPNKELLLAYKTCAYTRKDDWADYWNSL